MKCQWKDCPNTGMEELWPDGNLPHIFVCRQHFDQVNNQVTTLPKHRKHEVVHEILNHLGSKVIHKLCPALRATHPKEHFNAGTCCSHDGCNNPPTQWLQDSVGRKLRPMCDKHFDMLMVCAMKQMSRFTHQENLNHV